MTKFEKSELRSGKPIEGTVILPNPSVFESLIMEDNYKKCKEHVKIIIIISRLYLGYTNLESIKILGVDPTKRFLLFSNYCDSNISLVSRNYNPNLLGIGIEI